MTIRQDTLQQPLAWDFCDDGLRIWQGGEVAGIIPHGAHGNLVHALVKRMMERTKK